MQIVYFSLAYWCLFVAALLPLACAGLARAGKYGVPRRDGGYDHQNPRTWLARQKDWRARANAAQANSFEALPLFMAAVIIAQQLGAPQGLLDILAFLWVVLRILYVMMYVSGFGRARTLVWSLALLVNIGILFIGYR